MKIWTCGRSPRSGSRNAWTRIKNVNVARRLSNFWNFFGVIQIISCHDWWPWTKPDYITMTRRQSNNECSGGIAAHPTPKNSECKNLLEKFLASIFLRSRRHPLYWLSSKGPNYQHEVLLISAGAIEGHFERKTPREVHYGCLVLARQCPAHRALGTQNKLAYLGCQCLDHPPYSPALAPSDYHLFHVLKKQLKSCHFSSDAEVIAAAETWLDGQPSDFFLSGLPKLKQRAKKCIELHGEYVE